MALYITLGNNGGIWTGKPNAVTGTGVLHKEASGVTEPLYQAATDSDGTQSTFKVVVVGTGGSILLSNRTDDQSGTWAKVHTASRGLCGVAYGNGIWVAVGFGNTVLTSTNGSTWTARTGAMAASDWLWIEYGNGQFVAVGGATVNGQAIGTIMYSTDGITWTKGNPGTSNTLQSVAYSPDLNIFVAVGNNGSIVTAKG